MLVTSIPLKKTLPGTVFGAGKTPTQKFLMGVHSRTPFHGCCFKQGLNVTQDKCPKKASLY